MMLLFSGGIPLHHWPKVVLIVPSVATWWPMRRRYGRSFKLTDRSNLGTHVFNALFIYKSTVQSVIASSTKGSTGRKSPCKQSRIDIHPIALNLQKPNFRFFHPTSSITLSYPILIHNMEQVWDTDTQEPHGGQTWRQLANFKSDFSVTTNALGAPTPAVMAAKGALSHIHHYPAADNKEALSALSKFTSYPADRILVGNGASEFIDLIMKALPAGPFRPGPYRAAYMEYNRAALAAGRVVGGDGSGGVTVIIRPNSPTGEFMSLDKVREVLQTITGVLVLDESFMPFLGPAWRKQSGLSLIEEFGDKLLVIASWTKLWACPGIRLGSISGSERWIREIKRIQTPWSCNTPAQAFCVAACEDMEYMNKTWKLLPKWRETMESGVKRLGWKVNTDSPMWVPWVFVSCADAEEAQKAVKVAESAGCPVRGCKSYGMAECLRLGVRRDGWEELMSAWEEQFGVSHTNGNGV